MTDESKPRMENLEHRQGEALTPEQAEAAQGGAVDAFIWFREQAGSGDVKVVDEGGVATRR
jgi:hypothetical protein